MPAYPIGRLDFRLAQRDPDRRLGESRRCASRRLERPDQLLAEYQLELPAAEGCEMDQH